MGGAKALHHPIHYRMNTIKKGRPGPSRNSRESLTVTGEGIDFAWLFQNSAQAQLLVRDNLIVDCNKAAIEIFGAPHTSFIVGAHPLELSPDHQLDGRTSAEAIADTFKEIFTHRTHRFTWTYRKLNGETFDAGIVTTRLYRGDQQWILLTINETSPSTHASTEGIDIAANTSGSPMAHANPEGVITWANNAYLTLTGYTQDDILAHNVRLLREEGESAERIRPVWDTVAMGNAWEGELLNTRKDGTAYNTHCTVSPVIDENSEIHGYFAVEHDITHRVKADNELREAKKRAEDLNTEIQTALGKARELALSAEMANRSKKDFLSMVSHEIRTPLNAIIGFSELLSLESLKKEQKNFALSIVESSELLKQLIDDILDYSSMDMGARKLNAVEFDPRSTVSRIIRLLRGKAQDRDLELVDMIDARIPPVIIGDAVALQQILTNLVGNAIKFTEYGSVTVSVKAVPTGTETLDIRISVSDTGIGIPENKKAAIFEPFTQLAPDDTPKGSVGLGLSICKRLIERAGGSITCDTSPGRGTIFRFNFPCKTTC